MIFGGKLMLKTDERIYNGLIDIFDCEIIGSYKLVKENLLDLEDINDIDIYIKDEKVFKNIMRYLKNNGYIQKKVIMGCRNRYNLCSGLQRRLFEICSLRNRRTWLELRWLHDN